MYVEVHHQRKQVFLLNFRSWPAQKQKIWSILYGKKFLLRTFCYVNVGSSWFKNWYFPSSVCCSQLFVLHTLSHLLWPGGWYVTSEAQLNQFSITNSKSKSWFIELKNNATANHFSDLFSNLRLQSQDYRIVRASLVFYYSYQYCFYYYCY